MKDRQPPSSAPNLRIPILSPVLHCLAMPVIVYLRSSFGFSYLRPRSVFFALSWAMALFCVYVWHEREVWGRYWAVCMFGAGAILLYWTHFLVAFFRELYRRGEHDHDSGTSHLLRLLRLRKKLFTPLFEMNWQIWAEPGLVLMMGIVLKLITGEKLLSSWLMITAPCLSLKECLNFWLQLRQKKRHEDAQEDAFELIGEDDAGSEGPIPLPARHERVKRQRISGQSAEEELTIQRFSKLLHITPPFTLATAESSYRQLVKQFGGDGELTPDQATKFSELNEAIAFFRKHLSNEKQGSPPQDEEP